MHSKKKLVDLTEIWLMYSCVLRYAQLPVSKGSSPNFKGVLHA